MTPTDLALWRASLHMSQRAAAAALGVSLATYQAMERGRAWSTGKPITISRRTELACAAISGKLATVADVGAVAENSPI